MSAPERFDWIWCGVDDNGDIHVSLGRWQKHPCQFRYKFAEVQPTEHDHTRAMPTALAVPEVADLRKRLTRAIADPGATEGYKGDRSLTQWQVDAVIRALRGEVQG